MPGLNSCLKQAKPEAIGCRRESMMVARGNIRWKSPRLTKLPCILSTKRGLPPPVRIARSQGSATPRLRPRTCRAMQDFPDTSRLFPARPPIPAPSSGYRASSRVPSTWEWLARICSISVEPERGRPTMKIGSFASSLPIAPCGEEAADKSRFEALQESGGGFRIVIERARAGCCREHSAGKPRQIPRVLPSPTQGEFQAGDVVARGRQTAIGAACLPGAREEGGTVSRFESAQ